MRELADSTRVTSNSVSKNAGIMQQREGSVRAALTAQKTKGA